MVEMLHQTKAEMIAAYVSAFDAACALASLGKDDLDNVMINALANDLADNACMKLEQIGLSWGLTQDEMTDAILSRHSHS